MGCGASADKCPKEEAEEKKAEEQEKAGTGVSPSLQEYFQGLDKFNKSEISLQTQMKNLKKEGDKVDNEELVALYAQIKAKRMEWKNLRQKVLGEVFSYYDKSGGQDDKLSKEESTNLFTALTSEQAEYYAMLAQSHAIRLMWVEYGLSKKVFDGIEVENEEEIKKALEAASLKDAEDKVKKIQADKDKVIEDYKKNKAVKDEAAFMVLDKSGDGRIQKAEFMAAFDPASPVYDGFMTALGFPDAV